MKILHISLTLQGETHASLRYFWDNPSNYKEHQLPLSQIKNLIEKAETNYYSRRPLEYPLTGQTIYNWLDGSDRLLATAINEPPSEGLILAIATEQNLSHLPWELLHDGKEFLVEKRPPIIPIRWVSNGQSIIKVNDNEPQNRPLNLLFMATSPIDVEPVLDYEAEEGNILEATQRSPINLRVEESGWLEELKYVVGEYDPAYFDVFHLTGYGKIQNQIPCFVTEDEYGNQVDSNAEDIYDALAFSLPSLIFLSGCRTAYSSGNAVPSMAERLLGMGVKTVLGWGEKVGDSNATIAAGNFYKELAQGRSLTQALSSTYKALIKEQVPDWHKLKLYVSKTLVESLVTPLRTPKRKPLPKPSITREFIDDKKQLRVATREEFVGRRRQLQNCLRTLKTDDEKVGVLIYGMGGLGKSTIASRLCDRLANHEKIVWRRQIDEYSLINELKKKLIKPSQSELISYLYDQQTSLATRLTYLFSQLAKLGEKSFLFILDDFEFNLETREREYILKPNPASILDALVMAIRDSGTKNKIIITCRYEFNSELLDYFYKQDLDSFKKADLTKKLNRLESLKSGKIKEEIKIRSLKFADGNPRLLELLNDEVLGTDNVKERLTELENNPQKWKNNVIWEELYQLIDEPLQKVLSHCLVYDLPVPRIALERVCNSLPNYQQELERGRKLGLIERSPDIEVENRLYRVSKIFPNIIPEIQLSSITNIDKIYAKAADFLYFYFKYENPYRFKPEEKWKENFVPIDREERVKKWEYFFRLFLANKENKNRFEDAFFLMYSLQPNLEADTALTNQLPQFLPVLDTQTLLKRLEDNLRTKQWKDADRYTAYIFYMIRAIEKKSDWMTLLEQFPINLLQEIDNLWVKYSQDYFGFSVQKQILNSLKGDSEMSQELWYSFAEKVGWRGQNDIAKSNGIEFNKQAKKGHLPVLWATRTITDQHNFGQGGWSYTVADGGQRGKQTGEKKWQYICAAILYDRIKI